MSAKNAQALQALAEPLQYPGRMETYPGQMKGKTMMVMVIQGMELKYSIVKIS